jgi:hypothetical protein
MKNIFLLALGLSINNARSQDISDAMRYAQDNLTGTARYRAMVVLLVHWAATFPL